MSQPANEDRWRKFLSVLRQPWKPPSQTGVKLDKETLVGSSSISKKFAIMINPTFELDSDNIETTTRHSKHYYSERREEDWNAKESDDDDVIYVKSETVSSSPTTSDMRGAGDSLHHRYPSTFEGAQRDYRAASIAAVNKDNLYSISDDEAEDTDDIDLVKSEPISFRNLNDRLLNTGEAFDSQSEVHGRRTSEFEDVKAKPNLDIKSESYLPYSTSDDEYEEPDDIDLVKSEHISSRNLNDRLLNTEEAVDSQSEVHRSLTSEFEDVDANIDLDLKSESHLPDYYQNENDFTTITGNNTKLAENIIQKQQTKRISSDTLSDNSLISSKYSKTSEMSSTDIEPNIFQKFRQSVAEYWKGKPAEPHRVHVRSSDILPSSSSPLKAVQPKQRAQLRPSFRIDHRSTSVSKWDLNMFSRYVNFKEVVERLEIDSDGVDELDEMKNLVEETLNMFQTSQMEPVIEDVLHKEADVRILLTAILQKLCVKVKIGLRTEEQINLKYLPTCTFDFIFYTHDGKPIGCMEAKAPSKMNNRAFVQAVIQLLVLQQVACKHCVDISTVPVFNVLSDGLRFVLMQVKGEKLWLEHGITKRGIDVLKIRTSEVMESLIRLVKMTLDCMP